MRLKWLWVVPAIMLALGNRVHAEDDYQGPVQLEDGMYTESWFLQSFLMLSEDLEAAASDGKRFVIMWELKGCPYCKETHFKNFADPEIRNFARTNFEILQLNIQGSRKVTDFDGETLEERDLAAKYGVRFTPTLQFFPDTLDGLAGRKPPDREVARMPGYFRPPHFLAMFRFVQQRAYETGDFRSFLRNAARKP